MEIKNEKDLNAYLEFVQAIREMQVKIGDIKTQKEYDDAQVREFYTKTFLPALADAVSLAEIVVRNPDYKKLVGEQNAGFVIKMLKAWGDLGLKDRTKPIEAARKLSSEYQV